MIEQEEFKRIDGRSRGLKTRGKEKGERIRKRGKRNQLSYLLFSSNAGPTYITNSNSICLIANNRFNYLMTSLIGTTPFASTEVEPKLHGFANILRLPAQCSI